MKHSILYIWTSPTFWNSQCNCLSPYSILSLSEYVEKRRNRARRNPPLIDGDGFSTGGISGTGSSADGGRSQTPRLQAKHGFEASIGQDLLDKEGSVQEDRRRDLLEHSYSSLSEYHSHKQ